MMLTARHAILVDAAATTATAVLMLAARNLLHPYFGLASPMWLDAVALAFIVYAAIIALAAMRPVIARATLLAVAGANVAYVVASVALLAMFWSELHPVGRGVIAAVAVAVEVFAMLQLAAARGSGAPLRHA